MSKACSIKQCDCYFDTMIMVSWSSRAKLKYYEAEWKKHYVQASTEQAHLQSAVSKSVAADKDTPPHAMWTEPSTLLDCEPEGEDWYMAHQGSILDEGKRILASLGCDTNGEQSCQR